MRVAVECKSPLLQKSLELFLSNYLCSAKQCDIVVKDQDCHQDKRCLYISSKENADLIKPFSKAQLILALEKKYKELYRHEEKIYRGNEGMGFEILEKRIESLTQEYQENIIRVVKAFYEK